MNKLHPLIELQTVDSTNFYAEELLKTQKVSEGTIIFAHDQTSGKGQGENNWESEPRKNVTFSLVLFPKFLSPWQQFLLNKAISLGVLDFLAGVIIEQKLSIKWPNDIYAGNRKIGGILLQNTICGTLYESCIAGIGVNLNQETYNPGLPNPVSLRQITGKDYPVKDAVDRIVACIDDRYQQLQEGLSELLDREYREQLFGINEWRDYTVDKNLIKGKIRGVDESGMLIMETENGSIRHFNHREIAFVFH
ncbi:MAG: biotin--[acetyl-CoA-carboxylase] ligase [Bacteroidales bacterium]|jgi:BirA family biotin operon repressor/biotin-[acetyl-CoA-carboxylase] ligase